MNLDETLKELGIPERPYHDWNLTTLIEDELFESTAVYGEWGLFRK